VRLLVIFRRWEIRVRDLRTLEDVEPVLAQRFFTRRHALNLINYQNCVRLVQGAKSFTYYLHDRRDD
jgi:hypothetical protein